MPDIPTRPARPESGEATALLAALRAGDERVFGALVSAHHAALVRLAVQYVGSAAAAEEVAQEAWLGFVQSLDRFEGRSSVKTWLFRILLNCARSRRRVEVKSVPLSAVIDPEQSADGVDDARFQRDGIWTEHWLAPPKPLSEDGERRLLGGELRGRLQAAVDALPPAQREVVLLRDIEGLASDEVCELLSVSEANQRVLLHRARTRLRAALEPYLEQEQGIA